MDFIDKRAYLKRIIELHDENLYLKNQIKNLKKRRIKNFQSLKKREKKKMLKVNLKLLNKQISDLLMSNMAEDSKSGLHYLLGEMYDNLKDTGTAIIEVTQNE